MALKDFVCSLYDLNIQLSQDAQLAAEHFLQPKYRRKNGKPYKSPLNFADRTERAPSPFTSLLLNIFLRHCKVHSLLKFLLQLLMYRDGYLGMMLCYHCHPYVCFVEQYIPSLHPFDFIIIHCDIFETTKYCLNYILLSLHSFIYTQYQR